MGELTVATDLHNATGIPLLDATGLVAGLGEPAKWRPCEYAWLYSRALGRSIPTERFQSEIADAELQGVRVQEEHTSWVAYDAVARNTPYAKNWSVGGGFVTGLSLYFLNSVTGWGNVSPYPHVQSVAVHEFEDSSFAEVVLEFTPPFYRNDVTCSFIYGDAQSWAEARAATSVRSVDGDVLLGALAGLRQAVTARPAKFSQSNLLSRFSGGMGFDRATRH